MPHKEYTSTEYLAQQFRDFLRQEGQYLGREGGKWIAEQHGNLVQFNFQSELYSASFQSKGKKYIVELDNFVDGEYVCSRRLILNPKRSKTGRISREVLGKDLLKHLLA